MNEFIGWNLWHTDKENKCGKCGMKQKKDGCCKDEHKQLTLTSNQNHHQIKALVFERFFTPVIQTHQHNYNFLQPLTVALTYPKTNAPPLWRGVPIYLSNCVFLI